MPTINRRSVTIDKNVDVGVRHLMAILIKNGVDMDYTAALNFFAEFGIKKFIETSFHDKAELEVIIDLIKKHTDTEDVKEDMILDELEDLKNLQHLRIENKLR